ncbi:GNAT family N-acetyltransferase [Allokutzneria sp. A3M-2-11 16]|uniref:GNAT family N-acetyltransferase n=1 Tax=Allokutzneria sp. A3M-2-11 16 TaxID=2962043 RepID=UPI0020B8751C|nr:GNAT family N-acetyltransferase [Allokutzneria sp. A3M-2-11 16]MCP3800046.1 GNAT family N-acetyltransferase [Allokutzneria sp. A3M-2-11 16]
MNLLWRPMVDSDIPGWAVLLAAAERVDQQGEHYSEADLREEWADPDIDPERDSIAVLDGSTLVAYAILDKRVTPEGKYRLPSQSVVHPDWRGRGIGAQLVQWITERAGELHRENRPDLPGEVSISCGERNSALRELLDSAGFVPQRWFFELKRSTEPDPDVADQALPEGLRLIPYDARYDEALRLAHNEAFLDHWGTTQVDPEGWKHWHTGDSWFRPAVSYLVLDGEEVAGYLLSKEFEADAAATGIREVWYTAIGVRRAWRGNRLASALLLRALADSRDAGFTRAALSVDADNPTGALGIYQRCGFRLDARQSVHARVLSVTD